MNVCDAWSGRAVRSCGCCGHRGARAKVVLDVFRSMVLVDSIKVFSFPMNERRRTDTVIERQLQSEVRRV